MTRTRTKLCAAVLSLAFVLAAASQASAQHWRRGRDRDLSTGQKAGIIGGGAAAGAAIGALLGGKKGALIGGLIGGGAGTGVVVLKDRDDDRDGYYRGDRHYRDNRFDNRFDRVNRFAGRDWRNRDRCDRDGRFDRNRVARWRR